MPAPAQTEAGRPQRRPRDTARLFAALGDENRLRLVGRLCDGGPMSITQLADRSPISRQAVSQHLRKMERAGLVCSRRHGREVHWQLEPPRLDEARRYLEFISHEWDAALERLRLFLGE